MRPLNSFLARGGRHLNKKFPKIQMPGGFPGGGMLKLHFDWYTPPEECEGLSCKCSFKLMHFLCKLLGLPGQF